MLFVKDQDGEYHPAPKKLVLTEANKLIGYQLRRGASILSSECAKAVIGCKLRGKQCEVFACLFLDSKHRVLAFKEMFTGSICHQRRQKWSSFSMVALPEAMVTQVMGDQE